MNMTLAIDKNIDENEYLNFNIIHVDGNSFEINNNLYKIPKRIKNNFKFLLNNYYESKDEKFDNINKTTLNIFVSFIENNCKKY